MEDLVSITKPLPQAEYSLNTTDGEIVQQIVYDAFGNVTSDANPGFKPLAFAGGLYDPDTRLIRVGVRDYDPYTGRWTAKEPLRFSVGGGEASGLRSSS